MKRSFPWVTVVVLVAACSAEEATPTSGRRGDPGDPTGLSSTNAPQPVVIPGGMQGQGSTGTAGGAAPPADSSGLTVGDLSGCTGSSVTAPPSEGKVDIVWVVDASGSMLDEQMKIGANITSFADAITGANLDVHIVMLTTTAAIPVICPLFPPDPATGTALEGDVRYRFVMSAVDSHNALDILVGSYGQYSSFLRPDAVTHFIVVSDDESRYAGLATVQERADRFAGDMQAKLGKPFIMHTISSGGPTPCLDAMCMPDVNTGLCVFAMLGCGASNVGETYWELAARTQGLTASICEHDWSAIFSPLTDAVIASALPCNYPIPPPPPGETLAPDKVNVGWLAPGAADEELFGRAEGLDACADSLGWYYDNPGSPTEVLLCPATCDRVSAGGTLNVAFGCNTVLLD